MCVCVCVCFIGFFFIYLFFVFNIPFFFLNFVRPTAFFFNVCFKGFRAAIRGAPRGLARPLKKKLSANINFFRVFIDLYLKKFRGKDFFLKKKKQQ